MKTLMKKKLPIIYSLCILFAFLILIKLSYAPSTPNINQNFQTFTETLFCQELSSNTLNLHYTLKNPDKFNLNTDLITLGIYETDSVKTSAALENCLAALESFPYEQLSTENQLTYDILYEHIKLSLDLAPYILYEEPLSPLTGMQSQLPVLLSEYPFHTEQDIKTYLSLLKTVPAYINSLIAFQQVKSEAGLFMPEYSAENVIKECNSFIALGRSNYLFSTFETRLNTITDISESQKQAYISQNISAIETFIFPSFQNLSNALSDFKEKSSASGNLCHYPDGITYYEHLIRQQTGSDRSVIELKELITRQLKEDLSALQNALSIDTLTNASSSYTLPEDPLIILSLLKDKMKDSFPAPPDVNVEIKYIQKEMEEYLSPAFYLIPQIDNMENNTIYINQGHLPDSLDLFTTLAHEGYPGHLYQTTYFFSQNPSPIRSLINCGGYTEGWALYTEYISYYYSGLPANLASIYQHNSSLLLALYSLADIGIHYDGWSLIDTITFFRDYGIKDTETIQEIYELIIGDPANYLKYYIGYLEFLELKKWAIQEWDSSFTQTLFHQAVLDIGPAPFNVIKKHLKKAAIS